jgi:dihydrofolate synthase/folylpolyglutamate synthase
MVKDKDILKILSLLPKYAHYYFTKANIPRALPEDKLAEQAAIIHLNGHYYSTPNQALQQAINVAHAEDMILVCGSVFIVGEIDTSQLRW